MKGIKAHVHYLLLISTIMIFFQEAICQDQKRHWDIDKLGTCSDNTSPRASMCLLCDTMRYASQDSCCSVTKVLEECVATLQAILVQVHDNGDGVAVDSKKSEMAKAIYTALQDSKDHTVGSDDDLWGAFAPDLQENIVDNGHQESSNDISSDKRYGSVFRFPYGKRYGSIFRMPYGKRYGSVFRLPFGKRYGSVFSRPYGKRYGSVFKLPAGKRYGSVFRLPGGKRYGSVFKLPAGKRYGSVFRMPFGKRYGSVFSMPIGKRGDSDLQEAYDKRYGAMLRFPWAKRDDDNVEQQDDLGSENSASSIVVDPDDSADDNIDGDELDKRYGASLRYPWGDFRKRYEALVMFPWRPRDDAVKRQDLDGDSMEPDSYYRDDEQNEGEDSIMKRYGLLLGWPWSSRMRSWH